MKTTLLSSIVVLSLIGGGTVLPASAQTAATKKVAKPAPAATSTSASAKTPAGAKKPAGPIVLGTNQLPGDFGAFGTTYTIGKVRPINFTLKSAEYSITPVSIGNQTFVPQADEKLLVLHYTVHNPLPEEQTYDWSGIRFTGVDALDKNYEFKQIVGRDGTPEKLSLSLKPAQKVDAYAVMVVPAAGVMPKLIVEREKGAPVVRYDLRGKVAGLPAYAADATDAAGATARPDIAVVAGGASAPLGVFDMKVESATFTKDPIIRQTAPAGKRFLTVLVTIKNRSTAEQRYVWSDFLAEVRDEDGDKTPAFQQIVKGTKDEPAYGTLAPGEEARFRFFFVVADKTPVKTLRVAEGKIVAGKTARGFLFDISAAQ